MKIESRYKKIDLGKKKLDFICFVLNILYLCGIKIDCGVLELGIKTIDYEETIISFTKLVNPSILYNWGNYRWFRLLFSVYVKGAFLFVR